MDTPWPIKLFRRSVLKQRKFREITRMLGDTSGLRCLDLGGDNGVISYLFRERGGTWTSADLDPLAVESIRGLVADRVFRIDEKTVPFGDDEFDCIVIVDLLEHLHNDRRFVDELFRILRPGGRLIVNVPHVKRSLLRRLRVVLGQTDEEHGHVRPGYTRASLRAVLGERFEIVAQRTYSKVFSEIVDTVVTAVTRRLARRRGPSTKGIIIVDDDLRRHRRLFQLSAAAYGPMWLFSRLDVLLVFASGYMLLAEARTTKRRTA